MAARVGSLPRRSRDAQTRDFTEARLGPRARFVARWVAGHAFAAGRIPSSKPSSNNIAPLSPPGGVVLHIGDAENKSAHLDAPALKALGVTLRSTAEIPDVIVHRRAKNWLLFIVPVTSAGPEVGKRREEV